MFVRHPFRLESYHLSWAFRGFTTTESVIFNFNGIILNLFFIFQLLYVTIFVHYEIVAWGQVTRFDSKFHIAYTITPSNSHTSCWFLFKVANKIAANVAHWFRVRRCLEWLQDKAICFPIWKSNVDLWNTFWIDPLIVGESNFG